MGNLLLHKDFHEIVYRPKLSSEITLLFTLLITLFAGKQRMGTTAAQTSTRGMSELGWSAQCYGSRFTLVTSAPRLPFATRMLNASPTFTFPASEIGIPAASNTTA